MDKETEKQMTDKVDAVMRGTCKCDECQKIRLIFDRGRASGQQNADAVEVAAKAMWDSEPVVFAWGPPERRHASWEEAVERNLVGVEIFRQFARAMLSALAASPQITTPAAQPSDSVQDGAYSQGILGDGVCVLRDGVPVSIDEVVELLNTLPEPPGGT